MNETKKQATESPNREDVHEQREPDQPREGVVENPDKKADPGSPAPSRSDH